MKDICDPEALTRPPRGWVKAIREAPGMTAEQLGARLGVSQVKECTSHGRHSRLAADLLLISMRRPHFSWGRAGLVDVSETRQRYVAALRAAEAHAIAPLLEFVRS
jgi:hypothetical protein